ncbi:MAG: ABC transporter ATP-binding protein [Actinomycetota bacterium]
MTDEHGGDVADLHPVDGAATETGRADGTPGERSTPDVESAPDGALRVLRRGLARSPELRRGLAVTVAMGLSIAVSKLTIPVLIQRAIDRDRLPDGSVDLTYVWTLAAIAAVVILIAGFVTWVTQRRLVDRAETALAQLRADTFRHVHRLSIAEHNESQRGVLVARVTSDAEALARFAQWGLYSWTIHPVMIVGTFGVLAWYSWPLALIVMAAYAPALPWFKWLQRQQLAAYDRFRTEVGRMLSRFSETVTGADVIRAYGAEERSRRLTLEAVEGRYRARIRANRYMGMVFVTGDVLGAIAFSGVLVAGIAFRDTLGLDGGELVAILFLTTLIQAPIGELGETLDQTQTAVAGWRKILDQLDVEIDVEEPVGGAVLPDGALGVELADVRFAYRGGPDVLRDVSLTIEPGTTVAVVGETGSGKTTMAKLLCRLADPLDGEVRLGGVPLHTVDPASRLASVRMVPQDGFLFDTTIRENVRYGAPGADDAQVEAAFTALGLDWWVAKMTGGLDYEVGERGDNLSIGERQLVALARAALADPGLLILDEATSAVDPETDQALTSALRVLARGRTMVSIAHRLATAEAADLILVFDHGRLVEQGPHAKLVAAGGIYAGLHAAWEGNTRRAA